MGEGTDRVKEAPAPAQEEAEVERARARLDGLVAEIDRRRHELTDVRLQLRKHAWLVVTVALGAAAAIGATVFFKVRGHRKRRTLRGRLGRLREALGRMIDAPDRVAKRAPNLLKKVATAAAAAAASKVVKSVAGRAVQGLKSHPGPAA
jgi:hypothetical protein